MWNTKKEIVARCYWILWEDQSSTVFDKEGEVVPKIKEVIDNICRCSITNLITNQDIHGWLLDFLYQEKTLKIPYAKILMEEIDENSDTIVLDNTEWLDPEWWYVEINWNIIAYEWLSINSLTWVSWINGYHNIKSVVNYVYMFRDDLIKVCDFFDITRHETLTNVDFREEKPSCLRCFAVKPYGWDRKCAVFFNCEGSVMISYLKALPEMEDDEDECWFPKDYWLKIVPNLAIWELLIDTSESEKWKELLQMWYSELENMYRFYATPTKKFRKKIWVRQMRPLIW